MKVNKSIKMKTEHEEIKNKQTIVKRNQME